MPVILVNRKLQKWIQSKHRSSQRFLILPQPFSQAKPEPLRPAHNAALQGRQTCWQSMHAIVKRHIIRGFTVHHVLRQLLKYEFPARVTA